MKTRTTYTNYSHISSFDDFKTEREQLLIKKELIEVKMNLSFMKIRNSFKISDLLLSAANEFVIPRMKNMFSGFFKKDEQV